YDEVFVELQDLAELFDCLVISSSALQESIQVHARPDRQGVFLNDGLDHLDGPLNVAAQELEDGEEPPHENRNGRILHGQVEVRPGLLPLEIMRLDVTKQGVSFGQGRI